LARFALKGNVSSAVGNVSSAVGNVSSTVGNVSSTVGNVSSAVCHYLIRILPCIALSASSVTPAATPRRSRLRADAVIDHWWMRPKSQSRQDSGGGESSSSSSAPSSAPSSASLFTPKAVESPAPSAALSLFSPAKAMSLVQKMHSPLPFRRSVSLPLDMSSSSSAHGAGLGDNGLRVLTSRQQLPQTDPSQPVAPQPQSPPPRSRLVSPSPFLSQASSPAPSPLVPPRGLSVNTDKSGNNDDTVMWSSEVTPKPTAADSSSELDIEDEELEDKENAESDAERDTPRPTKK